MAVVEKAIYSFWCHFTPIIIFRLKYSQILTHKSSQSKLQTNISLGQNYHELHSVLTTTIILDVIKAIKRCN